MLSATIYFGVGAPTALVCSGDGVLRRQSVLAAAYSDDGVLLQ